MLDLKIVDEDQYDLVPVPLPGRLIVFAGPDGLMCRRNDGTITNYPAPAEGGGGGAPILSNQASYADALAYAQQLDEIVLCVVGSALVIVDPVGYVRDPSGVQLWSAGVVE